MNNFIKNFKYIIVGAIFAITGTAFAINVTVPSGNGAGWLLQSLSTGNYNPVSLTAGSNVTISTTTSNITISSSGGSGSFPFSADNTFNQVVYSTSTPTLWFKSGLFASSTIYGTAGSVGTPAIQVAGGEGLYQGGVGILSLSNGTSGVSWDGTAFYPNSSNSKTLGINSTNIWNKLFVNYASTTMTSVGAPATSWLLATSSLTANTLLLTNNGYPSIIVGKDDASSIANFEINSVGQGAYTSYGFKNDTGGTKSGVVGIDSATSFGGITGNVLLQALTSGVGSGLLIPMTSGNATAILRTYNGLGAIFNVYAPYQVAGTEPNISTTMGNSDGSTNTLDLGLEEYPGTFPTGKQQYEFALASALTTPMPTIAKGFWNQGYGDSSNATSSQGFFTASSTPYTSSIGATNVVCLGDCWVNGYSKGGGLSGLDYGVQGVGNGTGATLQIVATTTRSKALEVFKRSGTTYTSLFQVPNNGGFVSMASSTVVGNFTTTGNYQQTLSTGNYLFMQDAGSGAVQVGCYTGSVFCKYSLDGNPLLLNSRAVNPVGISTTSPAGLLSIGNGVTSGGIYVPTNGYFSIGSTTPGTFLSLGNTGNNTINIDPTATSTFGSGLNIRTGCFAINGTCIGGSGSGTVTSVGLSSSGSITVGSSPVTTSGTITANLNMGNANTWTALQTFANASTTLLSASYASSTQANFGSASTTKLSINNIAQYAYKTPGFSIATTTTWTGTTTAMQLPSPLTAQIINSVSCYSDSGTVNADIYHTSTHLTLVPVTTTNTTNTFSSNNTMTALEKWYITIGTPASSPTQVTCTFSLTPTGI